MSATARFYLRRSKNDEGKQQFSLDVQRAGCQAFLKRLGVRGRPAVAEYVDDGKAGDDFHSRTAIRQLMSDAQRGDIIVCRDQSRLGRDAIEVTLVVRDLVRDLGCDLYYYASGQRVQFENAIDQATTFIQGTGHQMELEAIRSRTREALRERVRAGRIAGGRCYGYELVRKQDAWGRPFTMAKVDDAQAEVVRRIYAEYLEGRGLKTIAHRLNDEGVPSPTVGRRGRGSWAPTGIREMLRNPRYRGEYIHGRVKKLRRGGRVVRVKADPSEVIAVDIPEWRIVDDETWFAVQERFAARKPMGSRGRPAAKYALSGIARCGVCGGSIGSTRTRLSGGLRVIAYSCLTNHTRGKSVCNVTTRQPVEEVDRGLLAYLRDEALTPEVIDAMLDEIRREARERYADKDVDTRELRAEVSRLKSEQRNLARAVAMASEIPELLTEMNQRSARLRRLEADLAAATRGPDENGARVAEVERRAWGMVSRLGETLADDRDTLRDLYLTLFPEGLIFTPTKRGRRNIWAVDGVAHLAGYDPENKETPDRAGVSNLRGDPTGT